MPFSEYDFKFWNKSFVSFIFSNLFFNSEKLSLLFISIFSKLSIIYLTTLSTNSLSYSLSLFSSFSSFGILFFNFDKNATSF